MDDQFGIHAQAPSFKPQAYLVAALMAINLISCESRSSLEEPPDTTGQVLANNDWWLETEVEVEPEGFLHISATGTVFLEAEGSPIAPDGDETAGECGSECSLPAASPGALIGQIGLDSEKFLVGALYEDKVDRSGVLYLKVNDATPDDNEGHFRVEISYDPPDSANEDETSP